MPCSPRRQRRAPAHDPTGAAPDKAERHLLFNAKPAPGDEADWPGTVPSRMSASANACREESRRNPTRLNKSMENAIQAVAATIEMRDPTPPATSAG